MSLVDFFRFGLSGIANTAFGFLVFFLAFLIFGSTLVALIISTSLGAAFNYWTYSHAFRGILARDTFIRFLFVYTAVLSLNYLLILGLQATGLTAVLSQAIAAPFVALLVFALLRRVVFNRITDVQGRRVKNVVGEGLEASR